MPKPVSIYDAARRVVQAERMHLIDGYLVSTYVEGRDVELMPAHRRGYERPPHPSRQCDIVNGWDDISQFVPGKR